MGKVSPKDRQSRSSRQKRRSRGSSNKYLKPGALAQLRYGKASANRSCTDLGKKRVAILDLDAKKEDEDLVLDEALDPSPIILSPSTLCKESSLLGSVSADDTEKEDKEMVLEDNGTNKSPILLSPINFFKQSNLLRTPQTPRDDSCDTESRLESLPMDLLVKVLCHLHHDQLRAVFHVSPRIRKAVLIARQFHFNYTTPDRSRQEMLRTMTPLPTEHWPFRRVEGKGLFMPSPHTPKAPRHGPRPPSRFKLTEMRQITAVLFQESSFPSRCMVPSVLSKPLCKSLASNRVLFYEDELCQAVAKNKLR